MFSRSVLIAPLTFYALEYSFLITDVNEANSLAKIIRGLSRTNTQGISRVSIEHNQ